MEQSDESRPEQVQYRFDPVTGADLRPGADSRRRQSFALQPGEPVASLGLVSSLLPLASGAAPQTFRWALGLGVLVPVLAGALGYLAFAFVAAAVLVPVLYVVYLYDVNQWEDQPLPVLLGAVVAAAGLGVGATFLWHAGILGREGGGVSLADGGGDLSWTRLLVLVLLVPVVSELLKQVGPLLLATRPRFDDLIDALTFGVAAGASYAAAETIVVNRSLFSSFGSVDQADAGFWVSLLLSDALVKPVVYGAATGIALAAFSGLGSGYDGFRPAYLRGLAEAIGANVAFQAGLFFAGRVDGTTGAVLGLVWGALVAAVLLLRLRRLLHVAVLEAGLAAAAGADARDTARGAAICASCEMPLVEGAGFCVVCGTAVRAASKTARARNRDTAAPATTGPGQQRDHRGTAVVTGVVLALVLAGGAAGQAVAAAQGEDLEPAETGEVTLEESTALDATAGRAASLAVVPAAAADGEDVGTGSSLSVGGGGLAFELAQGWELGLLAENFAEAVNGTATFTVFRDAGPTDLSGLVTDSLGIVDANFTEWEVAQPEQVQLSVPNLAAAAQTQFVGVYATGQAGTYPVAGSIFYLALADGSGLTVFAFTPPGGLDEDPSLVDEVHFMLGSLLRSVANPGAF